MKRYKRTHVATVLVAFAFSLTVVVGVLFFAGIWTLGSTYNVSAYVPNARSIAQYSTVFEAGLPVGVVTGVKRNGMDAILSLRITRGPRPLPIDTQIQLGLRSLAGEANVLLFPGHSTQTIRNGGSLGLQQDIGYTEVDQILKQFAGHTSATTRQFFQGFGGGLQGEGHNLNGTLGGFAALVNDSPPLTSTIAAQHQQVADIVQNFGNVMAAIGQRTLAVEQFARGATNTFGAVAARDAELKTALNDITIFTHGGDVTENSLALHTAGILPTVNELTSVVTQVTPALQELSPASTRGIELLNSLSAASPQLASVLVNLRKLEPSATYAMPSLHALTCQLNPVARYISPFGKDLASFFENFGAADGAYDYNHQLFANLLVDPTHFFRGVNGAQGGAALTELINVGIFKKLAGSKFGYNPNDTPGGIGRQDVNVGFDGPALVPANANNPPSNTFPHVTADCASTLPGGFHIG
jgi:phospholipid/cholesterol/gamma-HCH transport system substrate-binding protein